MYICLQFIWVILWDCFNLLNIRDKKITNGRQIETRILVKRGPFHSHHIYLKHCAMYKSRFLKGKEDQFCYLFFMGKLVNNETKPQLRQNIFNLAYFFSYEKLKEIRGHSNPISRSHTLNYQFFYLFFMEN